MPNLSGCRSAHRSCDPHIHADGEDADRYRIQLLLAGKQILLKGSTGRHPADPLLPGKDIRIDDDLLMSGAIQPITPE